MKHPQDTTLAVTCGSLNYLVNAHSDADGDYFTPLSVTCPSAELSAFEFAEAIHNNWPQVQRQARVELEKLRADDRTEAEAYHA